jgi:GDP-D-mannose dehydratase
MKKALITGITGQNGSYLAGLLLKRGYENQPIAKKIIFWSEALFSDARRYR